MWIRAESIADHDAIRRVTTAAFTGAAHALGTEARIIDALRDSHALAVSLVADIDGRIAGHVALSAVTLDDGNDGWYGLGPVSVDPRDQGNGVGSALVRAALAELPSLDARGCVVLGDPRYYTRFGFRPHPELRYPDVPAEYFMALLLQGSLPRAAVAYHDAFSVA